MQRALAVAVIAALCSWTWLARWQVTPSTQGTAYALDRWSGTLWLLDGDTRRKVEPAAEFWIGDKPAK